MNYSDIAIARLNNHYISAPHCNSIQELTGRMGALQAQDYNMAKWAIGLRIHNTSDAMIEDAIEQALIIRTHILRPTWHFVSSADIHWMLALSAPQIKAVSRSRDKALGLTDDVFLRGNALLEQILDGGKRLSRSEIALCFAEHNIQTDENRLYHFLMRAEIDGVVFSRQSGANKQTYSLLRDSVPVGRSFTREESAAMLAFRYFTSHGPATVNDFAWWSGLSVTESKKALHTISGQVAKETIGDDIYYFTPQLSKLNTASASVYLLPAFDEYIISYKDRLAVIARHHQQHAFTSNGIFKPIIVSDGQVIGTWKQSVKKDHLVIDTCFFPDSQNVSLDELSPEVDRLSFYSQKRIVVK